MKKLFSIILVVSMVLTFTLPTAFAVGTGYTDVSGHWAETIINKWSDQGVIKGYNSMFRPNDPITRGEFAVILDRVMDYQTTAVNGFSDLTTAFYTDAVLKANFAGVVRGYEDGSVKPINNISRQEAFVMIARAFKLSAPVGYSIAAPDAADVAGYAAAAVAALEATGDVEGREDGKLYPKETITRAEIVQILDNLIAEFITVAGTYADTNVTGDVVVNVPGVIISNKVISGNLIIAPGVGVGDVTLNNVDITGNIVVLGGGINSIKILGTSSVTGSIIISKVDGQVRVYTEDGVEVPVVFIDDGSDGVILEGTFASVTVNAEVEITLPAGTTIAELFLNEPADISGPGTIAEATLGAAATGSSFETEPEAVSAPAGVVVTIGDTTYTSDGTTLVEETVEPSVGGPAAITVSSVTLNLTGSDDITVSPMAGVCTFNLTGAANETVISGITVTTSSASAYVVGGNSITTNVENPMSTFLTMLGIDSTATITLEMIRALGDSFSVNGTVAGNALKVTFNVGGSTGYYSYTNNGTNVTATLNPSFAGTNVASLGILGLDPVALLIDNLTDTGVSTVYSLTAERSGIELTKTYTGYAAISGLTLTGLITLINANGGETISTLSDLTGITVTLTYGAKTLTLNMV